MLSPVSSDHSTRVDTYEPMRLELDLISSTQASDNLYHNEYDESSESKYSSDSDRYVNVDYKKYPGGIAESDSVMGSTRGNSEI